MITEGWKLADPALFPSDIVNRGISGQTTGQMLLRFREDVIALRPTTVHIMAGTNDVAGNPGAAPLDRALGNIASMVELARAHRIRVVLGAIPPAKTIAWRPGVRPAAIITEYNRRLAAYARAERIPFIDYHTALADAEGGMKDGTSNDGVHPTAAGYAIMRPLAAKALALR